MYANGFPHGPLCTAQGALGFFFYRASWIWVVLLTLQLYSLVMSGKLSFNIYHLHAIAWGTSLIFECIPLSTNNYGEGDENQGYKPCSIAYGTDPKMANVWIIATFLSPLIVCLFLMCFFFARLWLWHRAQAKRDERVANTIRILALYPISMFIFWVPNVIIALMANLKYKLDATALISIYVLQAWGGAYGIVLAIVFFSQSQEVYEC